jgi:predicted transcriptional regulator
MGKGKSSLEITLDLAEKEQERLEDLAEHDDKKVRRIVERAVKTYLALRRAIPDKVWEEIRALAGEKDVDPGAILGAYVKDGWKRRRRDL